MYLRFPGFSTLVLPLVLFLTLAGLSAYASSPAVPACAEAPTAEFLNGRLAYWQQRLNLGDWKLSVIASHTSDLKPETLGNVHWDLDAKTAVVRVLSPADYKMTCRAALNDMELTIVHELVHITMSRMRNAQTNRGDEEEAVVQITDALIKLDRANRQPHPPAAAPMTADRAARH